jgi:CYTH domain-containing protein/thymidylate kinase
LTIIFWVQRYNIFQKFCTFTAKKNTKTMNNVKRIVLTGGPCAGKTTALVRIIEYFSNLGFKVFTVPEVPTMYSQGGWSYLTPNPKLYYEGELAILQTQLALEDSFMRLAETCTKPTVVICDRGTLDISAYISPEMWTELCQKCCTTPNELRERYDAVLHLVSAADGAEQYYTTATNSTRYEQANEEGLQIARDLDKKVNKAWTGHPHLRVINNHDDFDAKLNRVLLEISNVLGLPLPVEEERVYLIELTGELPECIESEITQTYLVADPGIEVRLRRRSWGGEVVNVHKTKKHVSPTEVVETERQVSNALYESLLQQADPYRCTIRKTRRSFIWRGQYFEIDFFHTPVDNLMMLQTKGVAQQENVNFPPFIKVLEDITGNKKYYNYNLALRNTAH